MTRINCVPVAELCRQHLLAEYREIPRVFTVCHSAVVRKQYIHMPLTYCLGKGHVTFFYDKLDYIAKRHKQLVEEMQRRGYAANITDPHKKWRDVIPKSYWNDWQPTQEAIELNRARILERMPK